MSTIGGFAYMALKVGASAVLMVSGVGTWASQEASAASVAYESPAVNIYSVAPRSTDSAINNWLEPHRVYVSNEVPHKGYLFLFLPGSYGRATGQDLLQEQAAQDGFHGITLRYPNSWTVNDMCGPSPDPDCFEKVRMEIIDGKDRTSKVTISQANSIENRVVKLLQYLDRTRPTEGWGQYLEGAAPAWSKIIIAGHSQGAGHAAMIAKVYKVARVAMFGGPTDYSQRLLRIAPWLSAPHATPTEAYYVLNHTRDSLQLRELTWRALGLDAFGGPVNVDITAPPYGNSHQLVTSVATSNAHSSVVVDAVVPMKNGTPVFKDTWEYMAFGLGVTP